MKQRRNEILMKSVAERLKKLRVERGLSQQYVYIDTDINIGKIEVGRTNISISTLYILCNYYGISIEEFFKNFDPV